MNDEALRHAVTEELEWAPHVDASGLHVTVANGVVWLSGHVGSLAEKKAATRTVWHLEGVVGVRDDIAVRPPETQVLDDASIHKRVEEVLAWDATVGNAGITVAATDGVVTLSGTVDHAYLAQAAADRVHGLAGVVGLENEIVIRPGTGSASDLASRVHRALDRHVELDSTGIQVSVEGARVTLSGIAHSYTQRRIAENAAWAVAGVSDVLDLMQVRRKTG